MIAVISDIHGNWEALQAVSDFLESQNADTIYCLGDMVGYGANPREVVDWIRLKHVSVCLGNHDAVICQKYSATMFNSPAKQAIDWTRNQLSTETMRWMGRVPYSFVDNDFFFVHGSPENPEEFYYVHSGYRARESFRFFSNMVAFIGHTHIPMAYRDDGEQYSVNSLRLDKKYRYVINVGSVGQPRDGDSRACVTVIDDNYVVSWVRIDYNVEAAAEKIKQAGLPEFLASRLLTGK